jgi:hypothetical protein
MVIILWVMATLGTIIGGVLISDLHLALPAIAAWIIRRHAAKLPGDLRERMEEEWLGELEELPTHLQKLTYAVGLITGITKLIQDHREAEAGARDVTVRLTGVSATTQLGHVGTLDMSGQVDAVLIKGESVILIEAKGWAGAPPIPSTTRLFPGSVTIVEPDKEG